MQESVWFHEDDYGQHDVQPLGNMAWCEQELQRIAAHGAEHAVDTGEGGVVFTEMYLRADPPTELRSLGMSREILEHVMRPRLSETPRVFTGSMGGPLEAVQSAVAYGDLCAVWNEAEVITDLFAMCGLWEESEAEIAALFDLGARFPLLYVDWAWGFVAPLDGTSALVDRVAESRP